MRIGLGVSAPDSQRWAEAWLLDFIGCVGVGRDADAALAQIPDAIVRYLRFAARLGRGEPQGRVEITERFECFRVDRYEVNPIWTVDRTPATRADVDFAGAMLAPSREALLSVAEHAGDGVAGDRSVEKMLRHLADAEWWYGSRLEEDPERVRRYAVEEEPDQRRRLERIRGWFLDVLDVAPAVDDVERVHRGERWTARKVVRRAVYHELDHLRELQARVPAHASSTEAARN
ncbi:MAG: hypothetical protein AUH85_00815 [Chloroflexi bacterium 13_1_40CM_4_68_4]|nr:MAG: hypothetical protein AUH85_00815 [Chloroflexi bacterium 13_1_40CM_4_68_4]